MAALSVRVLGEFSVDGVDARTLADRKSRLLLRWLALARGRPVPTEALADALWADTPPARPADQVAVLASRLRRALGADVIERGDDGYRLRYDWLDLDQLAEVVTEVETRREAGNTSGAVAAARVGLALLRGPLPAPGTDAAWVLAEHASADRLVRRLRHVAASALLDTGDWPDALELAQADARDDPYDEEAVRLVMRAHQQAGRPAMALATFADLRTTLADELGADPAAETLALHEAILRGEPADRPAPRSTAVRLVGRSSQLAHLDALADRLRDPAARDRVHVAVVSGEAGIGKTTLLRTWTQARGSEGDVVLFGTCGPLARSAPLDAVLVAIAEHLRRCEDPASVLGNDSTVLLPLLGLDAGTARADAPIPLDPALGAASLYAALTGVLRRIAGGRGVVLVIDDAHLAGPTLADWLGFVQRRPLPLLVVVGTRAAEGEPLPTTDVVDLGPLDRAATAELVGDDRVDALFDRSGGHPLFLTELARSSDEELPPTLVAAVEQICASLGPVGDLLRAAAVLGTELDVELIASVTGRPPLEVLADVELAEARRLLVEHAGRYSFRHELVRDALAGGTRSARGALLHREAATALDRRPDADPLAVAHHARLGGDLPLAARALRVAAHRVAERFDHATAEDLLEQSLRMADDDQTRLALARVRIRRGRYAEAEADVLAAPGAGAEGSEVRAWAAYFDRRFDDAVAHAHDGELAADDPTLRARCQLVGGRTRHARGDLDEAERLLVAATGTASGADRITAAAWLGVLRAHRSQPERAIQLLRPATAPGVGVDQTSATLHALLFTGHAHAVAGRPAEALATFARYTAEVEQRQVPRFGGRGVNFGGWVLRNVGAAEAAREAHEEALAYGSGLGTPEVRIAALEDLAEDRLLAGDPDAAVARLDEVAGELTGDLVGELVFGWRLAMKHLLLRSRAALLTDAAASGLDLAGRLRADAERAGVPRYAATARLLEHRARAALGEPVEVDRVWSDLADVEQAVALEAWWWAGETGAELGQSRFLARAEELAGELARSSGDHADGLRREVDRRLAEWRLRLR